MAEVPGHIAGVLSDNIIVSLELLHTANWIHVILQNT